MHTLATSRWRYRSRTRGRDHITELLSGLDAAGYVVERL